MDLKQAVITTKYVIENNSRVVYVCHDADGWQFFGAEKDIVESDSRIVSLERIISANPHVKDVLWISENMEAWVNNEKDGWQTGVANNE
jgi:hypothetical protein